jgi:hypothetical protein
LPLIDVSVTVFIVTVNVPIAIGRNLHSGAYLEVFRAKVSRQRRAIGIGGSQVFWWRWPIICKNAISLHADIVM